MESAQNGAEQLMFRSGQLSKDLNPFWHLDFEGYHGLQSVLDIPIVTVFGEKLFCKHMSPKDFSDTRILVQTLKPLMKDNICFHLICMIMTLDTSNLIVSNRIAPLGNSTQINNGRTDCYNSKKRDIPDSATASNSYETSPSSVSLYTDDKSYYSVFDQNKRIDLKTICKAPTLTDSTIEDKFQDIKKLQNHYIHLLQKYCECSEDHEIRYFGSTDEQIKRTILCYKQLAYHVSSITSIMQDAHKRSRLLTPKSLNHEFKF